jgi:alpha-N-arabinofuranosidase
MYRFSYGAAGGAWAVLKDSVDATFLSTKIAGGFVGCMFALYATSNGQPSGTKAAYDWFEYTGTDDVYR